MSQEPLGEMLSWSYTTFQTKVELQDKTLECHQGTRLSLHQKVLKMINLSMQYGDIDISFLSDIVFQSQGDNTSKHKDGKMYHL